VSTCVYVRVRVRGFCVGVCVSFICACVTHARYHAPEAFTREVDFATNPQPPFLRGQSQQAKASEHKSMDQTSRGRQVLPIRIKTKMPKPGKTPDPDPLSPDYCIFSSHLMRHAPSYARWARHDRSQPTTGALPLGIGWR